MLAAIPSARVEGLTVQMHGDDVLLHDVARREFHTLNPTAAAIWRACDGTRTVDALALQTGFDSAIVEFAVDELSDRGLLASSHAHAGLTRRDVVRRLTAAGVLGAVALPIVGSITQSAAAGPLSCRDYGVPCTNDDQCCPGLTCISGNCTLP